MEFREKLQELRKQQGLTQEELAGRLYVSRTAVSKWESGRGYPNIDSLKAIAVLFSVTVDDLLSGDELLNLAQEDSDRTGRYARDLVFGLLDVGALMLLFLPFFAQRTDYGVYAVSLLGLTGVAPFMRVAYITLVVVIALVGVLTLALQSCTCAFWLRVKSKLSLLLGAVCVVLFVLGLQPYAAVYLFLFLIIKALTLVKRH